MWLDVLFGLSICCRTVPRVGSISLAISIGYMLAGMTLDDLIVVFLFTALVASFEAIFMGNLLIIKYSIY